MSPNGPDEETPLLVDQELSKVDVYERFSRLQKRVCVAAVSSAGLLPCECIDSEWERHALTNFCSVCFWVLYTLDS